MKKSTLLLVLFTCLGFQPCIAQVLLTDMQTCVDIEIDNGIMYMSNMTPDTIYSTPLSTLSPPRDGRTLPFSYIGPTVNDIAGFDVTGNYLYIGTQGSGEILKCEVDPTTGWSIGGIYTVFASGLTSINDIHVHGNNLFAGGSDRIYQYDLISGSLTSSLFVGTINDAIGFTEVGNRLYFSDNGNDKVYSFDMTASSPSLRLEIDNIDEPTGTCTDGVHLFVSETGTHSIVYKDLASTSTTFQTHAVLLPASSIFPALAYYMGELYYSNFDDQTVEKISASIPTAIHTAPGANADVCLYPIPCQNTLHVDIPSASDYTIMDIYGRIWQQGMLNHHEEIDVRDLTAGNYILQTTRGSEFFVKD